MEQWHADGSGVHAAVPGPTLDVPTVTALRVNCPEIRLAVTIPPVATSGKKEAARVPNPATTPPAMTILSDHPILREAVDESAAAAREGDSFELDSRLAAVYDIIRHQNTRAPLAIGIFGDWGTGKSSAMRWLSDQLALWSARGVDRGPHRACRTVWFEPWKFQTRDDVWRGLIAEVIINSINPAEASVTTVVSACKKFGAFLGRSFIHAVSSIRLKSSAEVTVKDPTTQLGEAKLGGEAEINLDSLTKIAEDYRQTVHPEKAYLNEFESTLKAWVRDSLAKPNKKGEGGERMVLFIDDLDRCLPAVTLEVLEALKLYLNVPQLVFVIGLDRDVVKAVIRKHYKDAGLSELKADSYLDKMFQVEVEVAPSEGQIDAYFERQVQELDAATNHYWSSQLSAGGPHWQETIEKTIKSIALHNPREVKRLLNSTLMLGTAAARRSGSDGEAAKRFGQGCQAYLIARMLRDDPLCPSNMLRFTETWRFLEEWSQFMRQYPLYTPACKRPAEAGGKEPAAREPEMAAAEAALLEVRRLVPRTRDEKREPIPLMDRPTLWDVLAIECSAAVGLAIASRTEENKPEPAAAVVGGAQAPTAATAAPDSATTTAAAALSALPLVVRSRIARSLRKDAGRLTLQDLSAVQQLDLSGSEIDDAGVKELARAETGLKALSKLDLGNAKVTNAGLKELARADTGLKALTTLDLAYTDVTDAGVKELARTKTGLKALTTLHLSGTQVTDARMKELAGADTGLKALTTLDLGQTQVTDAGLKELARAETGLKSLTTLYLYVTKVTDAGVKELARADTGLKALTELYLGGTKVTDAGLKELARADTGLKILTSLYLGNTKVTDAGLKELARGDNGLKALTTLDLGGTQVTDAGLKELARADTGLKALTTLMLWSTKVTDAGLKELARADTGLKALAALDLSATQVTDAGLKELASAETGLKALTTLLLVGTHVTVAGVAEVKKRFPNIEIIR